MLQIGKKATGDPWRDHYITPKNILNCVETFSALLNCKGFYDPCPQNPTFDGLQQTWKPVSTGHKVVYVNPPFSEYSTWLSEGISQYKKALFYKEDMNLIYVCNTTCEVGWYRKALTSANIELRTNYRIKFIHPITKEPAKNPRCSNTFFYFGNNKLEFIKAFQTQGFFLDLDTWKSQNQTLCPNFMEYLNENNNSRITRNNKP